MSWFEKCRWQIRRAIAGMLFLLLLMAWIPLSTVGAHEGALGLAGAGTVTVQATPTEDATVSALNKEKLAQEVSQQQRTWTNWLWSSAATISSTLVIVIGALIGLGQWRGNQRTERKKRAEERFQSTVMGLGDDKEGARIGAAILLRTFLRRGYEQFYTQTFDLVVANLRLPRTSYSAEDPDGLSHSPKDRDAPLPLTTLSQTLIVAFKEAFPRARRQNKRDPQSLDASSIQLDNAYLRRADLKQIWMPQASLRNVDLVGADLREAELAEADLSWIKLTKAELFTTNLREANLHGGDLREADLSGAKLIGADLREADLSGAKLIGADLSGAKLSRGDLIGASLIKANLIGANLSGANLSGANLFMTKLSGASFIEADLSRADLSRADLSGAKLNWADLSEANLSRVIGLTEKQLETYKVQGASIDGAPTTTSPQSAVSTSPAPQSNSTQAPPVQGDASTPDTGGSSATSSEQDRES